MKIKKIKASTEMIDTEMCPVEGNVPETCACPGDVQCKYDNAMMLIRNAIECLGAIAADDEVARDSIANLSVVLLDLKSNC